MTTLHIEHPISDYATWRVAFDRFEPLRTNAGVITQRICQPVDDDRYVMIQLDFAEPAQASRFLAVLRDQIWNRADASPALRGEPRTLILEAA